MNNILKKILIYCSVFIVSFSTKGQKLFKIKNEKEFSKYFFNQIATYNDTLSTIKQSGLVFIKFLIKDDGLIDNIKFSEKQPPVLLNVLTKILNLVKFDKSNNWNKTATYVLPILYNYVPELTLPITAEQLLNQVPIFNPDSLLAYMNFDFNGFFKVEETEKDLWGMKCVLLPMIKISRPIVYHHSNKKEEKEKLKKPKYQLD